jgi:hypothetical protein
MQLRIGVFFELVTPSVRGLAELLAPSRTAWLKQVEPDGQAG